MPVGTACQRHTRSERPIGAAAEGHTRDSTTEPVRRGIAHVTLNLRIIQESIAVLAVESVETSLDAAVRQQEPGAMVASTIVELSKYGDPKVRINSIK